MTRLTLAALALLLFSACCTPAECPAAWAAALGNGPTPVPGGWLRSTPNGGQVYVPTCCPSGGHR